VAQGELIGMRACGIPALRALAPVLVICAAVTPLYFVLNDEVLPRTNTYYHEIQRVIRGESRVWRSTALWYRVGNTVCEVADLDSGAGTANDIKIYELGEDARPISRVEAAEAQHIGGKVWRLYDSLRVNLTDGGIRAVPSERFVKLGEALDVMVDTRHFSVAELRQEIEEVEAGGMDATHYKVDYYVKWAAPLSCIVLPTLALFFAIGGPPSPSASLTGIVSVVAAVTFILATGVSTSLGYGKGLNPMVAGWGPPVLFGMIATYLGFRLRNLGPR
jgi:lipopolysaccharide export system permease protein